MALVDAPGPTPCAWFTQASSSLVDPPVTVE
jgi:hypothetical protein